MGWLEYPSSLPQQLCLLGLLDNGLGALSKENSTDEKIGPNEELHNLLLRCVWSQPSTMVGNRPTHNEMGSLSDRATTLGLD